MFTLTNIKYKTILHIEKLYIPENKTTCIIGESGSGKTTLLKLLNDMISPDSGEIIYKGSNIKDINPVDLRRRVVMLPQMPVVFSGTVKENLMMGLKFAEKPAESDEKLLEMLRVVSLNKELSDNAEKLSGGEKQRLALARVLLLQPDVLLLDEPSSALDEETEHLVIEKLVKYSKDNGKTMVIVTHSKDVAREYAENIVEIRQGKVVSRGGDSIE